MKNVISKTKYVLMALIMIVSFSCSPEDGADGAQGAAGPAGQDGTNGQNGEDGNANVQTFTFDVSAESGSSIDLSITEFTQSVLDNDVILWYLKVGNLSYPIPGSGPNAGYVVRTYAQVGTTRLNFHNWNGTSYSINAGDIDMVKIIIIESTNTTAKSLGKQHVFNELKAAGVDINNYNEVMDYYGLDY